MMRLRRASMILALLLLISAATAHADCAWVLWSNFFLAADSGPKLDDWDVVDTTDTRTACMARLEERGSRGTQLRVGERGESFVVWEPAVKKRGLVSYTTLKCLPDTVDPRGAKGK
jgi:hypothetical protein